MNVVLLGPPGGGKGTQASLLRSRAGLQHVSTGEMLREAIAAGSPLGLEVKATVESGRLVPDELVGRVVGERLDRPSTAAGVLFDGFPRTVRQAEMLEGLLEARGLPAAVAVELLVPEAVVAERLAARRECPACGPRPGAEGERCGACGAPTTSRADDSEAVVRERLRVYREQTAPVTELYRSLGRLREVDGVGSPEAVAERVAHALLGPGASA